MKKNKKDLIYYATLKHAAKYGVADIKTQKLAQDMGISEGSIFYHFKDMKGLVDYCATRYDRELMEQCLQLVEDGKDVEEIWDELFARILNEPEGGVYYFNYVNYFGFDPTESNNRAEEFLKVARTIFKEKEDLSDHEVLILWDYITTQLFYYTTKIYEGYIENTESNRNFIKRIVFSSYNNI